MASAESRRACARNRNSASPLSTDKDADDKDLLAGDDEEAVAVEAEDGGDATDRNEGAACSGSAANRAPENASIMSPACINRYLRGRAARELKTTERERHSKWLHLSEQK